MNLIERYLNAVEFWLPSGQKQDILAELSEDIHSQVEERQAKLGRELTEDEVIALLRQRGRPMLVANRFRPQRTLIGPDLFPVYWFVLRVVGFFYLVPAFMVSVVLHHVQHSGSTWRQALDAEGASKCETALIAMGLVTLVFAVAQANGAADRMLANWSPRQLLPPSRPISRFSSVLDIAAQILFLLFWMSYLSSQEVLRGPNVYLTLRQGWLIFYWGFLLLSLFRGHAKYLEPYVSVLDACPRQLEPDRQSTLWLAVLLGDAGACACIALCSEVRSS